MSETADTTETSSLDTCPPHLSGQDVYKTGVTYALRVSSTTRRNWPAGLTTDELWARLTTQQRQDLLLISLLTTKNLEDSSEMAANVGRFTLYEDNEIRIRRGAIP